MLLQYSIFRYTRKAFPSYISHILVDKEGEKGLENSLETLEKGSFIGIRRGDAVYGHFLHIVEPMVQKYWSFIMNRIRHPT